MDLNLHDFFRQHCHQTITVGFSGGVDSTVLLHSLAQARAEYDLTLHAVHVHHGLSEHADFWADFCINYCAELNIPITVKRVCVQSDGLGIEAAARAARYAAFREADGDCVALAHHQDDEIETFFLAALRGSGVRGLAAMAAESVSGSLKVVRPLLHVSRTQIEQYAAQHHLQYIEDESNFNPKFLRNWLRYQWLPQLFARLPHAPQHIVSAVATLQDELLLINEINQSDENQIYRSGHFRIQNWRELSPARRRQQLILFAKRHDLGTPRQAGIRDFERVLSVNQHGAQWALPCGKAVAYRGILFALSNGWEKDFFWRNAVSGSLNHWAAQGDLVLQMQQSGLPESLLHENMILRTVQAGDVLPMKQGSKSVKKLLQERGVPPFLRVHYPVLTAPSGEILAVVGLAVNQRVAVADGVLPVCEKLARFLLK